MKIHQLSLFLENKPGRLSRPCRALADQDIDILTLSLADTQEFGILRLIVQEWEKAKTALEAIGVVVNVVEVVAIEVADRPGGLAELLEILDQAGVNIEYMYAFSLRRGDRSKALMIFRFEEIDSAIAALRSRGVNVVGGVELFEQARP